MRSWRHPSEIAASQRAANADAPHGLGENWSLRSFIAGGAVGALVAVALVVSTGMLEGNDGGRVELRPATAAAALSSTTLLSASTTSTTSAIAEWGLADPDQAEGPASVPGVVIVYQLDGQTPVATALHVDGRLVTSASAVGEAERLVVHHDGASQEVLVRGRDPYSDIALLVPADGELLPIGSIEWAPDAVEPGDTVHLVALDGQPQPIVLSGQVLALNAHTITRGGNTIVDAVATSARLPELAGGAALVDDHGRAVGMVIDCADYLASAVPVSTLRTVSASIAETGWANPAWVGIVANFEDDTMTITETVEDSPSAAAGLAPGDRLLAIDGEPVTGLTRFVMAIRRAGPNTSVTVDVETNGQEWTTTMVVGERAPVPPVDIVSDDAAQGD